MDENTGIKLIPEVVQKELDVQDYRLMSKASDEFENGNYNECLKILDQLEIIRGSNAKLVHNRAVAQFYKSNCRDHDELLKILETIPVTKEINRTPSDSQSLSDSASTLSMHPLIPIYNKAVIYYHRQMYETTWLILQPLIQQLDIFTENETTLLGLLVLRILLNTNQLRKAYEFLCELLKLLGITATMLLSEENTVEEVLPRLENRLAKNLKLLVMLTLVVNKKLVAVPEEKSPEYAALKAYQYYLMKDFQMAAKQLKKINNDLDSGSSHNYDMSTLIANNMGVIHLRVRHYAIATKFFQNAINFDKHIASNLREADLHFMSTARSCEILYNLGIAMLHLRRPKEAFQCLLVPLKTYHSNPQLWFRIAEACIMEHELKRCSDEKINRNTTNSTSRSTFSNRVSYMDNSQSAAVPEPTMPFAALSLRNALTLLRNCSKVMFTHSLFGNDSNDSHETDEVQSSNWQEIYDNNYCNPSGPITQISLNSMWAAIYAAFSYVSLRLGDYVTALEMAQELLKVEKISDAHKMLGHMYAGEALIMMNKFSDARPHLEPTFVTTLNAFDFETKDWQVKSLDAAQNVVRYNLAVVVTLQGDFGMAKNLISKCSHNLIASKALALKIYIEKNQTAIQHKS